MAASPKQPAAKAKVEAPATPITKLQQTDIKKFLIITISLTTLLVIVGGYFIYQLTNKNIHIANEIKAQEIYLKLADEKLKVLDEAETALVEIKKADSSQVSDFARITERVMPPVDDLSIILTIFQKLETDSAGVKIDNISRNSGVSASATTTANTVATGAAGSKSFATTFKATGSYELIQQFLKSLESSQKVFDFSTLKISGTAEKISLDMTYKVYYFEKPEIKDSQMSLSDYQAKGGNK